MLVTRVYQTSNGSSICFSEQLMHQESWYIAVWFLARAPIRKSLSRKVAYNSMNACRWRSSAAWQFEMTEFAAIKILIPSNILEMVWLFNVITSWNRIANTTIYEFKHKKKKGDLRTKFLILKSETCWQYGKWFWKI